MEIILGLLALQNGLIGERLFVALVVMALVTSLMSGPFLQRLLNLKKPLRFTGFFTSKTLVGNLSATTRSEAIRELSQAVSEDYGFDAEKISGSVLAWEE